MQKRQKRILRVRTPLCSARNPYSCTCRLHTSASRAVHPCALCYNGLWLSGDIARTSTLYAHYKNWLRRARLHKNHLSRGVCENAPQRKRCVVEKETRFNERHGMMRCRYEKMRVCVWIIRLVCCLQTAPVATNLHSCIGRVPISHSNGKHESDHFVRFLHLC